MEQLDRLASEKVLRAMSEAGVDLEQLVSRIDMSLPTLMRRLSAGRWKVVELGEIAKALGCPAERLMPEEKAA